jgi:hypothetical protein
MSSRFQDDGRGLWDFTDDILVECPSCGRCAHVLPKDRHNVRLSGPRRVSCLHCGYARGPSSAPPKKTRPRWQKERRVNGKPRQVSTAMFAGAPQRLRPTSLSLGLPLYLQTPCAGHTLWALNARHRAWIEAFLAAKLRENAAPTLPSSRRPWSAKQNESAISGLPQWLILARHRDEALRAIAHLREKLLA